MCMSQETWYIKDSIRFGGRKPVFQLYDFEHCYIQVYDEINHIKWEILKVEAENSQSNDVNFKTDHQYLEQLSRCSFLLVDNRVRKI